MRSGTVLSSCNSNSLAASRRSQSVICRCTSGSDVRRRSGRGEKGRRGRRPRATTPSGFGTRFPLRTAPGLGTQTGRTRSSEMRLSGASRWGSARPRSPEPSRACSAASTSHSANSFRSRSRLPSPRLRLFSRYTARIPPVEREQANCCAAASWRTTIPRDSPFPPRALKRFPPSLPAEVRPQWIGT